jgi:hypothetical protein
VPEETNQDSEFATTRIPLPQLDPPGTSPVLSVDLPRIARLHSPLRLVYTLHNPSLTAPLRVTLQAETVITIGGTTSTSSTSEGGSGGENWAFAGPRRIGSMTVLPGSRRQFEFVVVPVGACGEVELPRVRAFQHVVVESRRSRFPAAGSQESDNGDDDDEIRSAAAGGDERGRVAGLDSPVDAQRQAGVVASSQVELRELELVVVNARRADETDREADTPLPPPPSLEPLSIFVVP